MSELSNSKKYRLFKVSFLINKILYNNVTKKIKGVVNISTLKVVPSCNSMLFLLKPREDTKEEAIFFFCCS